MAETRRLRKRRLSIDREAVVDRVLDQVERVERERQEWMNLRIARYAKLRGWREERDWPWERASNQHVPVMMANSLRVKAGLFNAVMGIRPVMTPKVTQRIHKDAADQANTLIDYQLFTESDGEQRLDAYIADFVDEGTAVSHQAWVRDIQPVIWTRTLPRPDVPLLEGIVELLPQLLPGLRELYATNDEGTDWEAQFQRSDGDTVRVTIMVYDIDEETIEIIARWPEIVYDGPVMTPVALEDLSIPIGCENTQPVSPQNPMGAPFVVQTIRVPLDHVRRMRREGVYDLLTEEDLDALEGRADEREPVSDLSDQRALQSAKHEQAGLQPQAPQDEERDWVTLLRYYGPWDLDGDGLNEEAIFWVFKETRVLARARYLSEIYPGIPLQRPFADTRFLPVRGEFYGIGVVELQEGLHDFLHVLVNQNIDNGTLANQPFFFYRASSGIKPDVIRLWPGEGYPVDMPQTDVHFPQMPHSEQTWAFNMIGLAMQFLDRLTQIGPLQLGQVPTGKASALRTLGTTMSILQQGAAMPEQILRRLFTGLTRVWHQFHQLNIRYLPKKKRYLIAGKPLDQDDAYAMVDDPQSLAIPVAFDFQATLLNTNKGLVNQALMGLGTALINPLMLQMGLVDPERIYNWAKDLIQAAQLDPARYIVKPAGAPQGERYSFEEVLLILMQGRLPEVAPLEPIQEHHQKALAFMQSEQFGLLTDAQVMLFREYLRRLTEAVRQAAQQQMMLQAAQQFAAGLGNQGQGARSIPGGELPMQTEAPEMSEMMGAGGGGGI